ncbi:hypothetical protein AMECASPLE_000152, partial [Ameca splendens]
MPATMQNQKGPNFHTAIDCTQEHPAPRLLDPLIPVMCSAVAEVQVTRLIHHGVHIVYSPDHPLPLRSHFCPRESKRKRLSPASQAWEKEELGLLDWFPHS